MSILTVSRRLVRDQANKTLDLYLQRVREYSSTMPDSVLPPPSSSGPTSNDTARIGTPSDKSWAGWAISSFTNRITTTTGEIQPTANGSGTAANDASRSTSIPRSSKSTLSSESDISKETLRPTSQPFGRSSSDQTVQVTDTEEQKGAEHFYDSLDDIAGNDNDKNHDQEEGLDADPFGTVPNAKPSTVGTSTHRPAPAPVPFDDGGEPDFAGWLAAKTKAKAKKPLPKGMIKNASMKGLPSRSAATAKPRRIVAPPKVIEPKPAEPQPVESQPKNDNDDVDDDWGAF